MSTTIEIAPQTALTKVFLPANLFQSIQCSCNTSTKYKPDLNAAKGTSEMLDIQCSIDEISHEQLDDEVLLTKAAKLLYKIIGKIQNSQDSIICEVSLENFSVKRKDLQALKGMSMKH